MSSGATAHPEHGKRSPSAEDFLNRELSWLAFNERVLHEAFDERNPLLERLKFIAIFSTNLDEFYMVRVAGLRRQVATGVQQLPPDGMSPQAQLDAISERVAELLARQQHCLHDILLPALETEGIRLLSMSDLSPAEWLEMDGFFESQVFPVLTPLAVDPGHPFPYISNLSLSMAVEIRDPERDVTRFARVKIPPSLPRWISFGRPHHFVPLEQVIGANLGSLFPGMEVLGWHLFRITRYSDLDVALADEGEDLLEAIEEQVLQRRFGEVVRVEVEANMPDAMRQVLLEELREDQEGEEGVPVSDRDVHEVRSLLELGDLMHLASLDIPHLRDAPLVQVTPPELRDSQKSIFDVLREKDVLVHHPFHSFENTVEHFLEAAADDPNVLAMKCTLYRTSGDTEIVRALTDAAAQGKQVAVLVELQARFDEANNITWARTLEDHGVHVAYGLQGLKTHTKTALVVRREADGIRRYYHIGTGNYNTKTARTYTDIGLLSSSPALAADLSDLFNMITGFSRQKLYRKLLVAPANLRERTLELIEREARNARQGREARIVAKMNSLVDAEVITALYEASAAGVEVDLIVRGICCLRPGVPGLSERIRVTSIVGRFLEHSRVFCFHNGGDPEYYIGSADWMPRNFDRRVEAVAPVDDPGLRRKLQSLLQVCLQDDRQAWDMQPDGTYRQRQPGPGPTRATHVVLMGNPWGLATTQSRGE